MHNIIIIRVCFHLSIMRFNYKTASCTCGKHDGIAVEVVVQHARVDSKYLTFSYLSTSTRLVHNTSYR